MAPENGSILGSMRGGEVDPDMQNAPGPNPFEANAAMLDDFAQRSAGAKADKLPIEELAKSGATIKYGPHGLDLLGLDPRLVIGMMEKSKRLDTIMGAMQQEGQRLQSQREQLQTTGGRIGNTLSVLAGNMATQRDMPGWVQGAGRTALQMNPTYEQVTDRQMRLGQDEAQIGQSQQRLMEARLRAEEIAAYKQVEHDRKEAADLAHKEAKIREDELAKQKLKEKEEYDRARIVESEKRRISANINRTGGNFDPKAIENNPKLDDATKAELLAENAGIKKKVEVEYKQKAALQTARLDAAKARVEATNTTKTAIANIGKMNQSAKEGLVSSVAKKVYDAEMAHARLVMSVNDSLTTDPEQKLKDMKTIQASEDSLRELHVQYEELKKKAQVSGPTMSSPEAAAKRSAEPSADQDPYGLFKK